MSRKSSPMKPKAPAQHTILERRIGQGYRKTGKINLAESSAGAWELAEYEKWLKEIKQ